MSEQSLKPNAVRTILCLANSRKPSGRCVAGREINNGIPGGWIRPVSDRPHQEVSERERQYQDGSDPQVLDVIRVPLIGPKPNSFQRENWLLDPNFYWQKNERIDWNGLLTFVQPEGPLWINSQSSYSGLNDRIETAQADTLQSSLRLIRVSKVTLRVFRPGQAFGDPKRRVQGQFTHAGCDYWLWVTDPTYERQFLQQEDGEYELGESCLTISLGEPHNGYAYKLIAAIVERARVTS